MGSSNNNINKFRQLLLITGIKCRSLLSTACVLLVGYVIIELADVTHNYYAPSLSFLIKSDSDSYSNNQPKTNSDNITDLKTILFWTPYYDIPDFTFGYGREPFIAAGCKVSNCRTTSNRSELNSSDAVIFHALQFRKNDAPSTRFPGQRFVFYLFEPIPNPCVGACLPTREYSPNYFNWTMTHRRDSDVYVAEPYGAIQVNYWKLPNQLPEELPLGQMPPDPAFLLNPGKSVLLANRTKMVAWYVSHCPTDSRREEYVSVLSRYVKVDIYGKCGNKICLPRNSPQCEYILEKYKFYLAMENSLCPDYVTEKFYRALDNGVVPIVYGGADYSQYAPPHSYINIADFKSPKELADYLKLLDKNNALYLKYFEWKKLYQVVRRPMKGWCDLCAKLNEDVKIPKSYADVAGWWVKKMPCYPGSSFLDNHM